MGLKKFVTATIVALSLVMPIAAGASSTETIVTSGFQTVAQSKAKKAKVKKVKKPVKK